ncbi:MAG: hypothetical protein IPN67_03025 [Bacteroidales bacterium]|nr:hypothetical protein [Bacteroidales bacterium]
MKKLMNKMFLSCLKATELIEKKLLFKLSLSEKIRLKMHKMMCDACTLYEKQTKILHKAMEGHPNKEELSVDLSNFKKDLIRKIEEADRNVTEKE